MVQPASVPTSAPARAAASSTRSARVKLNLPAAASKVETDDPLHSGWTLRARS